MGDSFKSVRYIRTRSSRELSGTGHKVDEQ